MSQRITIRNIYGISNPSDNFYLIRYKCEDQCERMPYYSRERHICFNQCQITRQQSLNEFNLNLPNNLNYCSDVFCERNLRESDKDTIGKPL